MNILHIDSSPLGTASVSRQLSAAQVAALCAAHPGSRVVYRDLAAEPLAHLDGELLQALRPQPGATAPDSAAVREQLALTERLLEEFLAADAIVLGAPFYNFSIPSQLKAWIDRIALPGRTFRYTASGPEGLAGGRKLYIVSSRGGRYAGQAHESAMDHQEAYLRAVFGFLGITDIEVLRAEGIGMGPEVRSQAIAAALEQAQALA